MCSAQWINMVVFQKCGTPNDPKLVVIINAKISGLGSPYFRTPPLYVIPMCSRSEPIGCQVANPSVFATNLAIKIDGEIRNPRPLLRKITSAGKKKTFGWYHYVNITMFAANIIVADKIKVMFAGSSIIAGKIIISG